MGKDPTISAVLHRCSACDVALWRESRQAQEAPRRRRTTIWVPLQCGKLIFMRHLDADWSQIADRLYRGQIDF
jgi:hypothetical protein